MEGSKIGVDLMLQVHDWKLRLELTDSLCKARRAKRDALEDAVENRIL